MRPRISERNILPSFSLEKEYKKLNALFHDKRDLSMPYGQFTKPLSYAECLNFAFLSWNLRGSFTSLVEMLYSLRIRAEDFLTDPSEDRLIDYIQFILNAVVFVDEEAHEDRYIFRKINNAIRSAIFQNSQYILEKLNMDTAFDKGEIYIIYKNDVASAVAYQNENLRASIVDYLKIDNRGDLKRKGEILCTLAKELELHEKALVGTEFKSLCKDTTFLLNSSGVRHYQDPDKEIEARFLAMNDKELEEWYDKTFNMFLACMAAIPYLGYKSDIKAIKTGEELQHDV